jgi:hypothetical protein
MKGKLRLDCKGTSCNTEIEFDAPAAVQEPAVDLLSWVELQPDISRLAPALAGTSSTKYQKYRVQSPYHLQQGGM